MLKTFDIVENELLDILDPEKCSMYTIDIRFNDIPEGINFREESNYSDFVPEIINK